MSKNTSIPECAVIATLARGLATAPPGGIVVACSGGLDSSVLLHALASLPAARQRGLRVVHIDHGLHRNSAQWAEHCRAQADALGLRFASFSVAVARDADAGREAAAREARYAALAQQLGHGELLAIAQHRDDQVETVLLKLLRGAGPEGLGGIRELRTFAAGRLWRPLLGLPRSQLRAYAEVHALHWIDDPSNADTTLSRNFLRHEILPRLRQHWPDADAALAHSARWNRRAAEFILDQAQQARAQLQGLDPTTLHWRGWLQLPEALRDPVLRLWLRDGGLSEPNHAQLTELERQLRDSSEHSLPCVRWPGVELRRYRELLYAMPPLTSPPADWQTAWYGELLRLPAGCGTLLLENAEPEHAGSIAKTDIENSCDPRTQPIPASLASIPIGDRLPALEVRFRRGGEALKPQHSQHTRELRLLFQESGIAPWQRARIPLIYTGKDLLAVGDFWLSDRGAALFERQRRRLVWHRTLLDQPRREE